MRKYKFTVACNINKYIYFGNHFSFEISFEDLYCSLSVKNEHINTKLPDAYFTIQPTLKTPIFIHLL